MAALGPENKWELLTLVPMLVAHDGLRAEDVVPVAQALRRVWRDRTGGARATQELALFLVAAAFWLDVPVATWATWVATVYQHRAPGVMAGSWHMAWSRVGREHWSNARVTQLIAVLHARAPQVSTAFVRTMGELWADGRGPLAHTLINGLSDERLARVRTETAFEAHGTAMAVVVAKTTPLTSSVEIARLQQVDWGARSSAIRCTLLHRCVWDACPPRVQPHVKRLIAGVFPRNQWDVLAGRTLLRVQRSSGARATMLELLFDEGLAMPLVADPVTQAACAREVATSADTAAMAPVLRYVLAGWPVLPAAIWLPAVVGIIRAAQGGHQVREALEAWWAANEDPARHADPALVEACLSSTDRALAQWALLTLVPEIPAAEAAGPCAAHHSVGPRVRA